MTKICLRSPFGIRHSLVIRPLRDCSDKLRRVSHRERKLSHRSLLARLRPEFHELRPGTLSIGPFTVTVDRMSHPVETYGMRVEHGGRVLAYSADTAPCDALLRLAQGADLFLCEASYPDGEQNPPDLLLTGREAGEAATKAGVGRLVLTHLVAAWCSEANVVESAVASFAGPVEVARTGARYEV